MLCCNTPLKLHGPVVINSSIAKNILRANEFSLSFSLLLLFNCCSFFAGGNPAWMNSRSVVLIVKKPRTRRFSILNWNNEVWVDWIWYSSEFRLTNVEEYCSSYHFIISPSYHSTYSEWNKRLDAQKNKKSLLINTK